MAASSLSASVVFPRAEVFFAAVRLNGFVLHKNIVVSFLFLRLVKHIKAVDPLPSLSRFECGHLSLEVLNLILGNKKNNVLVAILGKLANRQDAIIAVVGQLVAANSVDVCLCVIADFLQESFNVSPQTLWMRLVQRRQGGKNHLNPFGLWSHISK